MRVSKPVIRQGNALAVALTRELKSLGIGAGETVHLAIDGARMAKRVTRQGSTLSVLLTKELKLLGYQHGDWIEIEIVEDGDMETQKN
ncbi:MAG: hypothetical protein J6W53_03065 [Candidatus Methanomethylophilaceae archaeon]|nr:hypothetical protein [Candidatus Methanomethylophilaceae archaeon]